jgi:ATP-binding cassette subfamily F protein uup
VAYLDQLRVQLDENASVQDNLCEGHDTVLIGGQSRHVIGYLKDFLFSPERSRSPVRTLSGGERNRLLLAKLFTQPANVLVLDEPTNDLDTETLELLETLLLGFEGTLLLVSHDREFLNNVVTSTIAFDEDGGVRSYVGGYDDWVRQRPPTRAMLEESAAPDEKAKVERPKKDRPKKLSFKDKKELEALPAEIETLESEQGELHAKMANPDFYKEEGSQAFAAVNARLEEIEGILSERYERWEALEAIAEES